MGFGWAAANAHDKDPMTRGFGGLNGWVDGADFSIGHQQNVTGRSVGQGKG